MFAPEELIRMTELRLVGLRPKEIARKINKEFPKKYTGSQISTQFSILKTRTYKVQTYEEVLQKLKAEQGEMTEPLKLREDDTLYGALNMYDSKNLRTIVSAREHYVLQLLTETANKLKDYDLLSQYVEMKIDDVLNLPIEERKRVSQLLTTPQGKSVTPVSIIEILAITGINGVREEMAFLLPFYTTDVVRSNATLRSRVYDAFVYALHENRYADSQIYPARDRFGALVRINVKASEVPLEKVAEETNGLIKGKEELQIQLQLDLPLYSFCFPSKTKK